MQERLTIQDIARIAGVSKATVSRVLNRNPTVNRELSERVLKVIKEYDFVPNIVATGLAGGRTRLIGVLAPPLTWPAVPEIMRGVAQYIEETSYEIVLYSISLARNHFDVVDRILAIRMISGLLAIFPGQTAHELVKCHAQGLPLVLIDDQEEQTSLPWIGINNQTSAYEAVKYLLDLGHRRIAYLQGPESYFCCHQRYEGFCQALREFDLVPSPDLVLSGNFESESGYQAASQIFARPHSSWPTAIFASNDEMAQGVLECANQQGIAIPAELTVIGFDDNIRSSRLRPPLTTVRQPFFEMGIAATALLLNMINPDHHLDQGESEKKLSPQIADFVYNLAPEQDLPSLQLPTSLIVRASSASPHP